MTRERRTFALLGDPVSHSLSPVIYGAAFGYLGREATYRAIRVPAGQDDRLGVLMADLAAGGGGNVTVPHKRAAVRLVEERTPAAERTGAVNCFWADESGLLLGDNTDVGGFGAALTAFDSLDLRGASVLVLGAGGAARGVAVACADAVVERLDLINRTPGRAENMIDELDLGAFARTVNGAQAAGVPYDLVVNATSLGLNRGDPLPVSLEAVSARHALDLVYGANGTAWRDHARSLGVRAEDGLRMLVHQAILSVDRWFGCDTEDEGLAEAMLAAARSSAGR